jgi:predicted nuclease of restriction endonuclease-like (RecB) superfamily
MEMQIAEIGKHVKTLKTLILRSRYVAARQANSEMLKLYFVIGAYVSEHSRKGKWGTGVIEAISEQLSKELPGLRGFSARNIRYMRDFFEEWTPLSILQPVVAKLGSGQNGNCQPVASEIWQPLAAKLENGTLEIRQSAADELGQFDRGAFLSIGFTHHIIIISKCKTLEERLFYIRRCAAGFWSKDALKRHLAANEYATEGHAVNNFALTIPDDKQVGRAVQAFRSEYLLDFVNIVDLNETEEERDEPEWMLEMVMKVKDLINALGDDFCFMNVKKRFVVEDEEFYSDLVFYHRALKCMVAIELKKGKFKPAYLSQLSFYLSCLDKYVKRDDENPSIGLVLCHEMKRGVVELAVRDMARPIGVATYRTSADVPEEYKVLTPLLEGAKALLAETIDAEEVQEGE